MQTHNLTIIISLMSMGFFGGFTHCSGMCGPFVLSQVSNRLENISLTEYNNFTRLKNFAIMPYHFGRITTYTIIGFFCSFLTGNIKDMSIFNYISGFLLLFAAFIFAQNLLNIKFSLPFSLPKIKTSAILSTLFRNPQGINGYFLGIILGFIPCGLLYGAFALAASLQPPFLAAVGIFAFGIMTIPALFLTAAGGYWFLKLSARNFKFISKTVIAINVITLFVMALSLILK